MPDDHFYVNTQSAANFNTGSLGASEYDPLCDLERAVINAALEWWNHSLAEPQRLILLRAIGALTARGER